MKRTLYTIAALAVTGCAYAQTNTVTLPGAVASGSDTAILDAILGFIPAAYRPAAAVILPFVVGRLYKSYVNNGGNLKAAFSAVFCGTNSTAPAASATPPQP